MSDKIRGALFNTLGDISGLTVLDAFAGSGALSFEAISRGAAEVITIDDDMQAVKTIERNAQEIAVTGKVSVIRANAKSWSNRHPNSKFDLIFCDPPYDNIQIELVEGLAKHLKRGGILVMSLPPKTRVIMHSPNELISHKNYGDAELYFYKNTI